MTEVLDAEACFEEYCQFYYSDGWTAISLDDYETDINTFYIKPNDEY